MLVAAERRRKAMHLLMQDVRTVYWRAAAAQRLAEPVRKTIAMAEEALADSRSSEAQRLRAPLDSLRYQRQLLESLRLLEGIQQELASARIELSQLMNAPLDAHVRLAAADATPSARLLDADMATLETLALSRNADLRETSYNIRIAREEVRKAIARAVPNISFNYNLKYDTDNFLVNQRWNEAGLQVSYNLFNLLIAPNTVKLAKKGVSLAEQRQLATMMSVVTQVHLARLQYANSVRQLARADDIWQVDARIAKVSAAREAAQAGRVESRASPAKPLDVLVQHLVTVVLGGGFVADAPANAAPAGDHGARELYEEVRSAPAYATLTEEEFDWALRFCQRGGTSLGAYPDYHRIAVVDGLWRVPDRGIARRHRMQVGTIVADASMQVKWLSGGTLGHVEEAFIARLKPGDCFIFSGRVLEYVRTREMTAYVRKSTRSRGAVPYWGGSRMPLSSELADAVQALLHEARDAIDTAGGGEPPPGGVFDTARCTPARSRASL